jgi:electron transfer flavoprotein alpha subunit
VAAAGQYDAVFFANSILAADIGGGLAARLEAGVRWDLVDVELVGVRLAAGDPVSVEMGWTSDVEIATFRPGSFEPAEARTDTSCQPVALDDLMLSQWSEETRRTGHDADHEDAISLGDDAEIIVSAGRGVG